MKSLQSRLAAAGAMALLAAGAVTAAVAAGPVDVVAMPVAARSVATGIEYDGVVEPVRQTTVAAQATGRIASMLVKAGDRVRAGQVLATIDDRDTQAGLQRSQAQAGQAEAELRNAQVNLQRTGDLQSRGFVSKAALDQADTQLKAAQAARDAAGAGVRQSSLAQGFTRVTAPYDGLVLETPGQAGDLAVPGKALAVVYAPQPLRAVVQVPASRAALARDAAQVEVQVAGPSGSSWVRPTGRTLLPAADPVAQTLEWRLDLPAASTPLLAPGQQVRVRVISGEAARLTVPASAVLRRGELTAVYVAAGEGFALRAVRLGADHDAAGQEVLAGLRVDERVATDAVRAGLAGARPVAAPAAR